MRRWKDDNIGFHTYTGKTEKRQTFVIKGLHDEIEPDEIQSKIKDLGLEVLSVYKIKGTVRTTMFMVTIRGEVKLEDVSAATKVFSHAKMSWEKYVTKRRISVSQFDVELLW